MIKNVRVSAVLLILGEMLYWLLTYFFKNSTSNFSELTSGILLGLSVGMKIVGIILLLISLAKYSKNDNKSNNLGE